MEVGRELGLMSQLRRISLSCESQLRSSEVQGLDSDCLLDIITNFGPNLSFREEGLLKDPLISFFPKLPNYKPWKKLPDLVENWAFESLISPLAIVFVTLVEFQSEVCMDCATWSQICELK
jgi:hypothetical protein